MNSPAPDPATERAKAAGAGYTFSAYCLWGILPLYFVALAPTGPWEVVAWRVLLALVVCALLLTVMRGWRRVRAVLADRRAALWTVAAGALIYVNWEAFLFAAQSGQVLQASLGYFVNPITTVLLAVLVLHERLRPLQWTAVGIAVVAVVVIVVAYGAVPWIALTITVSFGLYGMVKQRIGPRVDAVSGLALESLWLTPVAILQLVLVGQTTGITMGTAGVGHALLLGASGIVTAAPLLLFASGARRVTLTTIGMMQFVAPILQFVVGAWILGEPMPAERWIGFVLVWIACAVLVADLLRARRRSVLSRESSGPVRRLR